MARTLLPILACTSLAGRRAPRLRRAATLVATGCAASAATAQPATGGALVRGDDSLMAPKAHGTTSTPVQERLRWDVDRATADRICSYNRHYAEYAGYYKRTTFIAAFSAAEGETTFYDSVSGKPLFVAPRGRTHDAFLAESSAHGWPSFRDEECVWDNLRILDDGEAVSVDGTHLGHNLPDSKGNRYCINLVSVAGTPVDEAAAGVTRSEL
ncbi:hypothetical protein EMIHUDRAFT_442700 [Emiliania huxleyi CCMP1516]|uniref:MsrB domain-containing protein n=2 Tax=Emiliania huxleyi TaxID=2903 RepID=A0A0D3IN49_EMIH1|nr:hypothetical protein EMIHUDRAFT_452168 [Emiliania huxleyi CCMP1516]XP_005782227.1 hypothetical protein EMIHUDRAFT_442700 [Emiliania huxleyi CCMP1516]EOD12684.1 hypothetical protein EMIHUDRAFT_452168 [Emiliania huxleyi CCMP1516]EOD29798.1 hypothetical protein EMIHUDRAFT_442700 [Emiliania huxleyi CCMP1516]|eukprot:XP_005765113.1 hypothetical protein EMIHUDRAFT_452168 [Emiliania huxleyi CCMP1516]